MAPTSLTPWCAKRVTIPTPDRQEALPQVLRATHGRKARVSQVLRTGALLGGPFYKLDVDTIRALLVRLGSCAVGVVPGGSRYCCPVMRSKPPDVAS